MLPNNSFAFDETEASCCWNWLKSIKKIYNIYTTHKTTFIRKYTYKYKSIFHWSSLTRSVFRLMYYIQGNETQGIQWLTEMSTHRSHVDIFSFSISTRKLSRNRSNRIIPKLNFFYEFKYFRKSVGANICAKGLKSAPKNTLRNFRLTKST